jgi:hypothetical protein
MKKRKEMEKISNHEDEKSDCIVAYGRAMVRKGGF